MRRSVIFAATSDRSAMEKVNVAGLATSAAEYFRDKGLHVNLMMDSLTRYCMALREVGISSGEQLGPGGYPPGVWYRMSRLAERSGSLAKGSITGFYTVLVEADDMNDPVADNARGILDGHFILSRRLAQRNHYPSIEVTESISRVMDRVVSERHKADAAYLRKLLAVYRENEELINLGAYARGSNPDVDEALTKLPLINEFLQQRVEEGSKFRNSVNLLRKIIVSGQEEEYY
jgi:flagellum-specific ATP synthase